MSAKPNFFKIGIFILGGIAVLVAALLVFGGGQIFRQRVFMETFIERTAQGVDIGSPVKFRGVLIGKVSEITFAFKAYPMSEAQGWANYVIIVMEIDREVFPGMFDENLSPLLDRNIAQGLRVRIEPQGITGLNYLDIDYVDPKRFPALWPQWKPRYYFIPSAPGEITSALESMNNIMHEVEQLNIAGISKNLLELLENLNQSVKEAEIEKVSADLQKLIVQFNTTLTEANIPELSADMRRFLSEVESSNAELRKILKNVEPSTRLDPGQVRAIINNLAETTKNIEQLSSEVKRRPSLLLWGTPPSARPTPTPRPKRD